MSFIKNNLPIVLVYLACSFVACNCAPALNTDALLEQVLAINAYGGLLTRTVSRQATEELVWERDGGDVSVMVEEDGDDDEEVDLYDNADAAADEDDDLVGDDGDERVDIEYQRPRQFRMNA